MIKPYTSLYIHVPFCHHKCDYCAFYSLPNASLENQQKYIQKISDQCHYSSQTQPLQSIFIGGGTPSALSLENLCKLLSAVKQNFTLTPQCEWTMEANPESLTPEKIACLAEAGVNRISIGIQSFQNKLRTILGRQGTLHNLDNIMQALSQYNIQNLNFDLIYNIPKETLQEWQYDLKTALSFPLLHLSAYSLMLQKGTPLALRLQQSNSEDDFLNFWHLTNKITTAFDLHQYEIANFAKINHPCRHNTDIWHGATYLGLGPAATSFNGKDRFTQQPHFQQWLADTPPEYDPIFELERAAEILAFGMRTTAGWTWKKFYSVTGLEAKSIRSNQIKKLAQAALITVDSTGMRPTPKGLLCNDSILEELI